MSPDRDSHTNAHWPVVAIALGLVLLGVSPWLPNLLPSSAVWSDDDARAYTEASNDLHAKSFSHSHGHAGGSHAHTASSDAEREAAQQKFDSIRARLNAARSRQQWPKYIAQTIGLLTAAAGVIGYFVQRR